MFNPSNVGNNGVSMLGQDLVGPIGERCDADSSTFGVGAKTGVLLSSFLDDLDMFSSFIGRTCCDNCFESVVQLCPKVFILEGVLVGRKNKCWAFLRGQRSDYSLGVILEMLCRNREMLFGYVEDPIRLVWVSWDRDRWVSQTPTVAEYVKQGHVLLCHSSVRTGGNRNQVHYALVSLGGRPSKTEFGSCGKLMLGSGHICLGAASEAGGGLGFG